MDEFTKMSEGWGAYQSVNKVRFTEAALAKAIDLLENRDGLPAHVWEYRLKEAITTSTFPYLFGNVIEREVIARYKACVPDWKAYFTIKRLRDFRTVYRHKVQGNDDRMDIVVEKGEYLVGQPSECRIEYHLDKYGRQFDISWEAVINDDLGAFDDIAARFATAAVRTEAINATKTFVDADGPHALYFGATVADPCDAQAITNLGSLPLTILNLETTMELMSAQVDIFGEPLCIRGVHLVVPPALEFTARQILTSTEKIWIDSSGGTIARPYPTTNVISQVGIQLHIDPYLPVVDNAQGNNADTTWYLFADPSQVAAMEFGYLRGHETPEIVMKASDKVTMGGGAVSPFTGDFVSDNIFYRVRIVKGSLFLDPRAAYAQTGTATET